MERTIDAPAPSGMVSLVEERADIVTAGLPPVRYLMNTEMDTVSLATGWLALGLLGFAAGVLLCLWAYRMVRQLDPGDDAPMFSKPGRETLGLFGAAFLVRLVSIFADPLTEFEMTTVLMVDRAQYFPGLHEHIDAASRGHFPLLLWVTWLTQGLSGALLAGRLPAALAGALAVTLAARALGRDLDIRRRAFVYAGLLVLPAGVFISRWTAGYAWVLLGECLMVRGVFDLRQDRERAGWIALTGGLLVCASFQANGVFSGALIACIWLARFTRGGVARQAAVRAVPALFGVALIGSPWLIPLLTHRSAMTLVGDFLPYHPVSSTGIASDIHQLMRWTLDLGFLGAVPVVGGVPVVAGVIVAGLVRAARADRESAALVIGLLLTFGVVFVNMALGPYLFEGIDGVYFHMRQHCALVVLGGVALWGWLRGPELVGFSIGAILALVFLVGWLNLEGKERQPDYENAFTSIAREFQWGDSLLLLPSYTNWAVVRHYGQEAARKAENKPLADLLDKGYEQPRFIVPIRVPLADQLRSTLIGRLWVVVVDDRVWGVYPHHSFEYTKRGLVEVDQNFKEIVSWAHENFMAWRLMGAKSPRESWPGNEKLIEAGVNDLYYVEGVQPPPLLSSTERSLTWDTRLRVTLPENTCDVHVAVEATPSNHAEGLVMKPLGSNKTWNPENPHKFPVEPNTKIFELKLRPANEGAKVIFQRIRLKASPCPEPG